MEQRPIHVAFALILTFLTKPASKKLDPEKLYIDQIVGIILSVVFAVYMYTHAMALSLNIGMYTQFEVILGAIVLLLVIEGCRRLTGIGLITMPMWAPICLTPSVIPGPVFLKFLLFPPLLLSPSSAPASTAA